MAKKDYKAMAAGIIKQAGGADNIVSATHCMTRLRLVPVSYTHLTLPTIA